MLSVESQLKKGSKVLELAGESLIVDAHLSGSSIKKVEHWLDPFTQHLVQLRDLLSPSTTSCNLIDYLLFFYSSGTLSIFLFRVEHFSSDF